MQRQHLHNQVDILLFQEGCFHPIHWLLQYGWLDYQDYQTWLKGDGSMLMDRVKMPAHDLSKALEIIQEYAQSLDLQAISDDPQEFTGGKLVISHSERERRLIMTRFEPAQERLQMDLFLDSAAVSVAYDLVLAIVAGRSDEWPNLLKQLKRLDVGQFDRFQQLLLCRSKLNDIATDVDSKLELLQHELMPQAYSLLGRHGQAFITPFWLALTEQLNDKRFDVVHPERHVSFTAAHCYQWQRLLDSVYAEPDWRQQPILIFRLAETALRLQQERVSLIAWFRLFFDYPLAAQQYIKQSQYSVLLDEWRRFNSLEWELDVGLFPTWVLVNRPALAILATDMQRQGLHDEVFLLMARVVTERQAGISDNSIAYRQQLQQYDPELFACYMAHITEVESELKKPKL